MKLLVRDSALLGQTPVPVGERNVAGGAGRTAMVGAQASGVLWQRIDTGLQDKFQGPCQSSLRIGSGQGGSEG